MIKKIKMTFYIRYVICSREVERDESILYNKKINSSYGPAKRMCKLKTSSMFNVLKPKNTKGKTDAMQHNIMSNGFTSFHFIL